MIYLLLSLIAACVLIAWLRVTVKRAVVQPVRMDNGLLLDARLTNKSRWQVFWDDNKAGISFLAGVALAAALGWMAF